MPTESSSKRLQKRSPGLCNSEEKANLPGQFQRKTGTEARWPGGEERRDLGERETEVELRGERGARRCVWGGSEQRGHREGR